MFGRGHAALLFGSHGRGGIRRSAGLDIVGHAARGSAVAALAVGAVDVLRAFERLALVLFGRSWSRPPSVRGARSRRSSTAGRYGWMGGHRPPIAGAWQPRQMKEHGRGRNSRPCVGRGGGGLAYGSSTASMTWITPLETSMSAATIRASSMYGIPPRTAGCRNCLLIVRIRLLPSTSPLNRSPGAT